MNITKDYFKKCLKATDLQNDKKEYNVGDYFVVQRSVKKTDEIIECNLIHDTSFKSKTAPEIWIPTIDQLFKLIPFQFSTAKQTLSFLYSFTFYIKNKDNSYKGMDEQILAYAMFYLYEKRWDEQKEEWYEKPKQETLNED